MQLKAKEKPVFKARNGGIQNLGIFIIMLVFIVIVVALSGSKFLTPTNLLNLLRSISVTGLMAVATTLVMITGNIDLSLGWMIGLAACITGVHSDNTAEALVLAILACAACGAFNGILVGVLKLNAFITTLGTMYAFKGITMMYSDGKMLTASVQNDSLKFIGQGNILGVPTPIWIFLIAGLIFWFLLKRTTFGNRIYAVGANPVSAKFSGVSSARIIMATYILTGIVTGIAGVVFYSKVMSVQPYSGAGLEFDVLTAIVLGGTSVSGGKGNVLGTIIGVIFVGILSNGFTLIGLGSNAQYITQGVILILAMRADVMSTRGMKV